MTTTLGPTNSLTDVPGIRVGQATRHGAGWLSGCTVVLSPAEGAVAGVDVRGGGPGTRETDLLDPRNLVDRVHAVVLSGGSAFGLATADGVMAQLASAGIGFPVGAPGQVVPIVPASVIFDLARGGDYSCRPDASTGAQAYRDATADPVTHGCVGAGTGARAGGLKGGVGSASAVLHDGVTVAALVVVNSVGSTVDPRTGELYAARFGLSGEFPALGPATEAELAEARHAASAVNELIRPPLATTIGVIATDATLTKAQCAKVSGVGHDGLARAIRPVHTMFDGDTLFTLATGSRGAGGAPDPMTFHRILDTAGDCVTRAVGHAMLAAETVTTPAGTIRSYRDAFPSAVATTNR
ncbi:MAG: hydrolase [Actinomycetales bacterium]|nr:MAG: hydrolase [Actinomycetales bacterium]